MSDTTAPTGSGGSTHFSDYFFRDFSDYWTCRLRAYRLLGLPHTCSDDRLIAGLRCHDAFARIQTQALDSVLPNWRDGGNIGLGRWRWVVDELERLLAEADDDKQAPS